MTKILLRILIAVFAAECTFLSSHSWGLEVPADWNFKKITTAHFDVIFDARQQELGERYAQQAEKAYAYLTPVFSTMPAKTLIIINDKTDATNGYATRIPYPHIMIYPVLPGPHESLSESGDWSLELIAHEYTHILTFEPANGVFHTLRGVFGSIAAPNLLLPNWWKEGLAVQIESSLALEGGRSKSIYQDASIRAMSANQTLKDFTIDQVNDAIPTWPEGMRSYLFGSLFWIEAVKEAGVAGIDRLNLEHSKSIPYFLAAPSETVLKNPYEVVYTNALNEADRRAQAQIQTLQQAPLTELKSLPFDAKYSSAPAISDDGKYLALITVDYKADRVMDIFIRDPQTKVITQKLQVEIKNQEDPQAPVNKQDGPPSGSIQKIAWFHHSPKLVFDQLHYVNRIERYSDISMYDLATQKTKRLTQSLRAREPSVSPDDSKIVYVKLEGGRTKLGLFDIAKDSAETIFVPAFEERVSSPVFVDANTLLFAIRGTKGQEELRSFSLVTKQATPILTAFPQARFPSMTKDGLLFTSSLNGVHNLYLASADLKSARPVSHVLSMVSNSTMDPETEQIYATVMTAEGTRVQRIEKADWQKTPKTLPKIGPLFEDRFTQPLTLASDYAPLTKFEMTDYSPGPYLWPRYWIPFVWTSPEGGLVIQALTSGFDPLQKHSYSVMVGWDTFARSSDWSVTYLNNVTSLPIQATATQLHSYLVTPDNRTEDTLLSLSALPDIWSFSEKTSLELGWRYLDRQVINRSRVKRTGPYGTVVYRNITQGGEQFTPETGYGGYLSAVNYIAGNDQLAHSQLQVGGVTYFSKFLPKLHAIMLRASALYTPEVISPYYGVQSDSTDYLGKDLGAKYLIRGFYSGQFLGRNMYNASIEYRFPVLDIYHGNGTTPIFWRRLYGAVTADALATDGYAFEAVTGAQSPVTTKDIFSSVGLEAHLETTLGYEFPITAVLGVYKGSSAHYTPDPTLGLALQFGGF